MASYRLILSSSFERDIRKLPNTVVARVMAKARTLADDPFPQGVKKLHGKEDTYRLRVGDYRVVYSVDTRAKVVDLIYARHRKDIYRKL
jgi:mRNA interferase RelE/StbE